MRRRMQKVTNEMDTNKTGLTTRRDSLFKCPPLKAGCFCACNAGDAAPRTDTVTESHGSDRLHGRGRSRVYHLRLDEERGSVQERWPDEWPGNAPARRRAAPR